MVWPGSCTCMGHVQAFTKRHTARNHKAIRRLKHRVSLQWKSKWKVSSCGSDEGMRMMLTFLTRTISVFVLSWGECCSTITGETQLLFVRLPPQSTQQQSICYTVKKHVIDFTWHYGQLMEHTELYWRKKNCSVLVKNWYSCKNISSCIA